MPQTCVKGVQDSARLGQKGDPLGIVQEIKIWPNYLMAPAQTRSEENKTHKILGDFEIKRVHSVTDRKADWFKLTRRREYII